MASVFGHALTALTVTDLSSKKINKLKLGILTVLCSILPDADVLMFRFGFHYDHWLGHRGFFHSLFFAFIVALIVKVVFYNKLKWNSKMGLTIFAIFFFITASHGFLDAMTTGGRGIAFFSPFDNTRHFLPWRMIQVSPLGASRFFSEWGIAVLKSEAYWIGIPCLLIIGLKRAFIKS